MITPPRRHAVRWSGVGRGRVDPGVARGVGWRGAAWPRHVGAISGTVVTISSSGEARHLHQHAVVEGGTVSSSAIPGTAAADVGTREALYRPAGAAVEGGTVGAISGTAVTGRGAGGATVGRRLRHTKCAC